jgi:hypothetical protein
MLARKVGGYGTFGYQCKLIGCSTNNRLIIRCCIALLLILNIIISLTVQAFVPSTNVGQLFRNIKRDTLKTKQQTTNNNKLLNQQYNDVQRILLKQGAESRSSNDDDRRLVNDYNNDDDSNIVNSNNRRRLMSLPISLFGIQCINTNNNNPAFARGLVEFPCKKGLANTYHFLRVGTTLLEEEGTKLREDNMKLLYFFKKIPQSKTVCVFCFVSVRPSFKC